MCLSEYGNHSRLQIQPGVKWCKFRASLKICWNFFHYHAVFSVWTLKHSESKNSFPLYNKNRRSNTRIDYLQPNQLVVKIAVSRCYPAPQVIHKTMTGPQNRWTLAGQKMAAKALQKALSFHYQKRLYGLGWSGNLLGFFTSQFQLSPTQLPLKPRPLLVSASFELYRMPLVHPPPPNHRSPPFQLHILSQRLPAEKSILFVNFVGVKHSAEYQMNLHFKHLI